MIWVARARVMPAQRVSISCGLKKPGLGFIMELVRVDLQKVCGVGMSPSIIPAKFSAGRNDPCPCDSGKKFKKCCLKP